MTSRTACDTATPPRPALMDIFAYLIIRLQCPFVLLWVALWEAPKRGMRGPQSLRRIGGGGATALKVRFKA